MCLSMRINPKHQPCLYCLLTFIYVSLSCPSFILLHFSFMSVSLSVHGCLCLSLYLCTCLLSIFPFMHVSLFFPSWFVSFPICPRSASCKTVSSVMRLFFYVSSLETSSPVLYVAFQRNIFILLFLSGDSLRRPTTPSPSSSR